MIPADRVLSTPPLDTSSNNIAEPADCVETKRDIDWKSAYFAMENFVYEMTYMAQIADVIIEDARDDDDSWNRLAFAVNHVRTMLDDFDRRYQKRVGRRLRLTKKQSENN